MGVAKAMLMVSLAMMMLSYSRADIFVSLAPTPSPPPTPKPTPPPPPTPKPTPPPPTPKPTPPPPPTPKPTPPPPPPTPKPTPPPPPPPTPKPTPPPSPPPTPTPPAPELVSSEYFDVKYDRHQLEVKPSSVQVLASQTFDYSDSPVPIDEKVTVEYKDKTSVKWSSTGQPPVALLSTVVARVPYLGFGDEFDVTKEEGDFKWNSGYERIPKVNASVVIPVQAFGFGGVQALMNLTNYKIPFNYSRRDIYSNGSTFRHEGHDGIFKGCRADVSFRYATYPFSDDTGSNALRKLANYARKRSFVA